HIEGAYAPGEIQVAAAVQVDNGGAGSLLGEYGRPVDHPARNQRLAPVQVFLATRAGQPRRVIGMQSHSPDIERPIDRTEAVWDGIRIVSTMNYNLGYKIVHNFEPKRVLSFRSPNLPFRNGGNGNPNQARDQRQAGGSKKKVDFHAGRG